MAQRKQVSWAQLRVGLLVVVSLTILALMIFLMTGQGYFTSKTRLVVYIDNAGGLKKGDPVRLTGIDVGNVDDISVSGDPNPNRAVVVSFHVTKDMMKQVRQDSQASLQVEGLLGQRFIDLSRGSMAKAEIPPGGEVPFKSLPDFGDLMASGTSVMTNVNRLVNTFNGMAEHMQKGEGTLGRLIYDDSLYKQLGTAVKDVQSTVSYVSSGKGSAGKLIYSDEIYDRLQSGVTKLDTMIDDVHSQKGSLGKLIYDPALYDDTRKLVSDAGAIVADANAGKGTLGKILKDETFYNKATATVDKVDAIAARIERGEGTIGKLTMKDDPLHGNLNSMSLELRELLADFRKNPKKFLTIQLKIF